LNAVVLAVALLAIVIPTLIIVVVLGSFAVSRGKKLRCPECGTVFSAPAFDEKLSGLGWTFPYMGNVRCPKCGEKRARRDYLKPEEPAT